MAAPYLEIPEKRINQAKRAQMKRMGGLVSAGSRKRCKKGKSCGATCINSSKVCWVDFPWAMATTISKTRDKIAKRTKPEKPPTAVAPFNQTSKTKAVRLMADGVDNGRTRPEKPLAMGAPSNPSRKTKEARLLADKVDSKIVKNGLSLERGEKNYDWEASKGAGSKFIGNGVHGTVTREGDSGNIVKRGRIGGQEVLALEKVSKLDLGPRLIAAQEDGPVGPKGYGARIGRVAMTLVPGEPIGLERGPGDKIGGQRVADAYWRARAELHRAGVAHNDMHVKNILIDGKGKGRFVDFGMSVISPRAALSEAMGAFAKSLKGDYHTRVSKGTGGEELKRAIASNAKPDTSILSATPVLRKIWGNRVRVMDEMTRDGLSQASINAIINYPTTPKAEAYTQGVWSKISDSQAQKYINMLYEGV